MGLGIGAWIFNVIFILGIAVQSYGEANKKTLPEDNVEASRWSMLILLIIIPVIVAIIF